jgi:hypothetical protein
MKTLLLQTAARILFLLDFALFPRQNSAISESFMAAAMHADEQVGAAAGGCSSSTEPGDT